MVRRSWQSWWSICIWNKMKIITTRKWTHGYNVGTSMLTRESFYGSCTRIYNAYMPTNLLCCHIKAMETWQLRPPAVSLLVKQIWCVFVDRKDPSLLDLLASQRKCFPMRFLCWCFWNLTGVSMYQQTFSLHIISLWPSAYELVGPGLAQPNAGCLPPVVTGGRHS